MERISRRSILKLGGLTVASALAGRAAGKADTAAFVPLMRPFGHADATLLVGPMLEQFRAPMR